MWCSMLLVFALVENGNLVLVAPVPDDCFPFTVYAIPNRIHVLTHETIAFLCSSL